MKWAEPLFQSIVWKKLSIALHLEQVRDETSETCRRKVAELKILIENCISDADIKSEKTEVQVMRGFYAPFIFPFLGHAFGLWVFKYKDPSQTHYHWWVSDAGSPHSCEGSLRCTWGRGLCARRHPHSTCLSWKPSPGPPAHRVWPGLDWKHKYL